MLPQFDRVQVCSPENGNYLLSFLPGLAGKLDDNRAGIATVALRISARWPRAGHACCFSAAFAIFPIRKALNWFTHKVLPAVLERMPDARLVIVGADPPPQSFAPGLAATTSSCADLSKMCASRCRVTPYSFARF